MYLRSNLIPIPFTRLVYTLLGAKIGENTYPNGVIYDPCFVTIGKFCVIGAGSNILPHAMEGHNLGHFPIHIGDRVTIGGNAVILPGCRIEDDALVATGALVKKDTVIGKGEIWAGIPAKKIGMRQEEASL